MNPVRKDMELLSNSMATYAHIKDHMESFALYFMLGVCFGLLLALTLFIMTVACRAHPVKNKPVSPDKKKTRDTREEDQHRPDEGEEESDADGDDDADDAEVPKVTVETVSELSQSDGPMSSISVFSSAEELERARRLEERERILREIWRTGQPDILLTGTGTLARVHYH